MPILVDTEKCTGCGNCLDACPLQAVSLIQDRASIDHNKCNECLRCLDECPNEAIYQLYDKDVAVAKRQNSLSVSNQQTYPQSRPPLGIDQRTPPALEKPGMFLEGIKKVVSTLFGSDSSFSQRTRSGRKGQGKHRRRQRRGKH